MTILVGILIVLVGVIALFLINLFNSLTKLKMTVSEATADIETFLKQRYDMIPNLVEIVKGYAKHEKEIFENVTQLRSKAMGATTVEDQMALEGQLDQAITKIFAVAENYPQLKADKNFSDLQANLKDLETDIQKSRRFYNGTVRDFNTKLEVFPNNLIVSIFGFKAFPFFEASEEEKENVQIKF